MIVGGRTRSRLVHLLGARPVMDQLEHLGPQYHRTGSDRRSPPTSNLSRRRWPADAVGGSRRAGAVAAADQAGPAGVVLSLSMAGFDDGKLVGAGVEEVVRREPRLALGAPVAWRPRSPVHGAVGRQVALHDPAQERVAPPRSVPEAAITLGGAYGESPAATRPSSRPSAPALCVVRRGWRSQSAIVLRPPGVSGTAHPAVFEHGDVQHQVEAGLGSESRPRPDGSALGGYSPDGLHANGLVRDVP